MISGPVMGSETRHLAASPRYLGAGNSGCPLWVKKRTCAAHKPMSAKCQKRTFAIYWIPCCARAEIVYARADQRYSGSAKVSVMSLPKASRARPGIVNILIT